MRDLGRGDRRELRRHLRLRMGSPPRLRRLLPLVITPSSTRPQPKGLRERLARGLDHGHTEHGAGLVVPAGGCLMREVAIAFCVSCRSTE